MTSLSKTSWELWSVHKDGGFQRGKYKDRVVLPDPGRAAKRWVQAVMCIPGRQGLSCQTWKQQTCCLWLDVQACSERTCRTLFPCREHLKWWIQISRTLLDPIHLKISFNISDFSRLRLSDASPIWNLVLFPGFVTMYLGILTKLLSFSSCYCGGWYRHLKLTRFLFVCWHLRAIVRWL